jgi:hypothetical protein
MDFSSSTCPFHAKFRPGSELPSFLFRHPRQDRDQQRPDRPSHVEPGLPDGDDFDAETIKGEDLLDVAHHRAAETIECVDDDSTVLASMGTFTKSTPGWPVLHRRHLLLEDLHDLEASASASLRTAGRWLSVNCRSVLVRR